MKKLTDIEKEDHFSSVLLKMRNGEVFQVSPNIVLEYINKNFLITITDRISFRVEEEDIYELLEKKRLI